MQDAGYKNSTVNRDVSAIGSIYKWARRKQLSPANFVSPIVGLERLPRTCASSISRMRRWPPSWRGPSPSRIIGSVSSFSAKGLRDAEAVLARLVKTQRESIERLDKLTRSMDSAERRMSRHADHLSRIEGRLKALAQQK